MYIKFKKLINVSKPTNLWINTRENRMHGSSKTRPRRVATTSRYLEAKNYKFRSAHQFEGPWRINNTEKQNRYRNKSENTSWQ